MVEEKKSRRLWVAGAVGFVAVAGIAGDAWAYSSFVAKIPNGSTNSCATCHEGSPSAGVFNPFGTAFKDAGTNWTPALAEADSDGDGETNGTELGDPCGEWTVGAQPARTTDISSPGDAASVSGACQALGVAMLTASRSQRSIISSALV
jgi:hypothetical protein